MTERVGYVKLWRKATRNRDLMHDGPASRIFLFGALPDADRQGLTDLSVRQYADMFGMGHTTVKRALDRLVEMDMLRVHRKGKGRAPTTYRIVNYHKYQGRKAIGDLRSTSVTQDQRDVTVDPTTTSRPSVPPMEHKGLIITDPDAFPDALRYSSGTQNPRSVTPAEHPEEEEEPPRDFIPENPTREPSTEDPA